jgi:hypothetical protein
MILVVPGFLRLPQTCLAGKTGCRNGFWADLQFTMPKGRSIRACKRGSRGL